MSPEVLIGIGAALALLYWTQVGRPKALWRAAVKTASVVALVFAAVAGDAPTALGIALLLSSSGDWALAQPGRDRLVEGMIAFGIAHLSYIVLFLMHYDPDGADAWRWAALVALLVFGAVMARLLWLRAGALRGAVMAYLGVILLMGLFALGLPGALWGAMLAAGLFVLSDTLLSLELFVLRHARVKRAAALAVWPVYWGAQAGFVWAFLPA